MNAYAFHPFVWGLSLFTMVALAAEPVSVVTVRPHAVDLSFPADAVVEAVQQSTLGARLAGRILEVRADAGQVVNKGDVLMRLDAREALEAARAADAVHANAKVHYERQQQLKAQKFVSQAAVDKAKADLDAAAANRTAAAAGQSHATIVAPMAGVIARRHAEVGDMAMPGAPLFTLYQPGSLRVTANIPQYRLKDMRAVRTARVEFPELGKWVTATSVQILPTADAATHVSPVRIGLPAMPEAIPGMFARVHFVTGQADKLTVPSAAVLRRGEVSAVYVQAADGRFSLRQLRLGETVGHAEIEVLAGLTSGDKVATDPVRVGIQLKSGQ
ncbi:efflux RND transporter periplasmic adaptor subunit [Dechloromonas sp. CZR5]|uniref:efflux RND transporter periplasmic adaptor subunit n=1 Tax=Dechloromonas sp. CZR5 TaxID=2608630 RepID=UPI001CC4534E|nr:efflux RND transporter periplasmic adaptor subunit [Dechloromonas sp. CZR5]